MFRLLKSFLVAALISILVTKSFAKSIAMDRTNFQILVDLLDADNNGKLSVTEVVDGNNSNLPFSESVIEDMFSVIDTNGDGELSVDELMQLAQIE